MPHKVIQNASNKLALLASGASPYMWNYDGHHRITSSDGAIIRDKPSLKTHIGETQSLLDAEYIYTMQPVVAIELSRMLESQAALHYGKPYKCFYCNPDLNPLKLECPIIRLSETILDL